MKLQLPPTSQAVWSCGKVEQGRVYETQQLFFVLDIVAVAAAHDIAAWLQL
jgi:hypothetical protein